MDSANPDLPRPPRQPAAPLITQTYAEGKYQRALPKSYKDAFVKLSPRQMVKTRSCSWFGSTIVTALLTIDPYLWSLPWENQRLFNGLITVILFFTVVFANFAESVAEGQGQGSRDALRSTKSDTTARLLPDGAISEVSSTTHANVKAK